MRTLFALTLALLLAGPAAVSAYGDALDFKTHVLDPVSTPFPTTPITTTTFQITFAACQQGELPGGMTADGCFAAVNRTGLDWTALEFVFPNTSVLASQPVSCAPAPSDNIFSQTDCELDPTTGKYVLDFSSGVLANSNIFFVTEDGVPFDQFPVGQATVTATTATPEPASFVLLGTGVLLLGGLALHRIS